ncbi:NAD(P)-dependent oxidoreductase [Fructilactobacillus fructivorans]|uniref:Lactate dehydrogenase n=1 Tax=Fructilactobacillus fructivorans TaxID=1614 RepID=A0AAE6P0P8_9LACO|nr:NAD(P)-dependent oxidoreductase [Fructilactobacillus fructivorans]KRK58224.1 D-lactate dehydrogenase [Fructilactobacillus fructivorans]KRN12937.1 D-lactate dehydrogenase [Fructilactobacillus fructivorans]KRN40899.1 D-lactate dehydrogenase [Fructilactobacillus fructivorans]QFX92212.1 lactate dehydrogenase [Fructilactobacillus fructivorans]RDV65261.1 lactate dehydrogenase [Fructilactobacillus fructivorans]
MAKITAYDVRPFEKEYFVDLNSYDFDLNLVEKPLSIDTVDEAMGTNAILIDGSCTADKKVLDKVKDLGIKYLFTRFVGYNNIDLDAAKADGIMVANVPSYSPYSVAELALTMGMDLFRHVAQATVNTNNADFRVLPTYYSNEIHDATVGIIGVGHMGSAEAKLYHNLGAKVLGYQRHPNDNPDVTFVSEDELLEKSDIVSLHVPYVPGENDEMIGGPELAKMKRNAILVNTARGELVDTNAITIALSGSNIGGYAADVIIDENQIDGNEFNSLDDLPNKDVLELMKRYPNVIITPHIGYLTKPATIDMIKVSYDNFHEAMTTGKTKNQI